MLKFAIIACVLGALVSAADIEIQQDASDRFFLGKQCMMWVLLKYLFFQDCVALMSNPNVPLPVLVVTVLSVALEDAESS